MPRHAEIARPPLRPATLTRALVGPGALWTRIEVVAETGSTNADAAARARSGAAEGLVLIAESQSAGRGRLDRVWQAPARAGLTMSVLLRPPVPSAGFGWLPLLTGVAVAQACGRLPGVDAALKWPNDLLVRAAGGTGTYGKCAGILAETLAQPDSPAVVIGIGLNVSQRTDELPEPQDRLAHPPTSLALAGAVTDREPLTIAVLESLSDWYQRWVAAAGDPVASGLRDAYRGICLTIGRDVTVLLPNGASLSGQATGIDADGRLVLATERGRHTLAAGDVQHVR